MGLKFKNQNPISDNNTLKVYFCTQTISDDPNDPYADDDIIIVLLLQHQMKQLIFGLRIILILHGKIKQEKILQEKITGMHGQIITGKKLIMYI